MSDPLMDALVALFEKPANPCFDMIMFDLEQHTLSFRRAGDPDEWVNVWLHATEDLDHMVERNGGPAGTRILWQDGYFSSDDRHFIFYIPQRKQYDDIDDHLRDRVERKTFGGD